MAHSFVFFKAFEVNGRLVVANNIDEAISIFREESDGETVTNVQQLRDGEYALCKIADKNDIQESFGED